MDRDNDGKIQQIGYIQKTKEWFSKTIKQTTLTKLLFRDAKSVPDFRKTDILYDMSDEYKSAAGKLRF